MNSDTQGLDLVFIWHHHQPDYRHPRDGRALLPWVRLHATKDYLDMALHLERHSRIHSTFNFAPSLLSPPATPLGVRPVMSPPVTPPPPLKRTSSQPDPKAAHQPQLAAAKPVNIFADESPVEKPTDDLPTIFAEELISEKSLDEVILAFLSADLVEPPK